MKIDTIIILLCGLLILLIFRKRNEAFTGIPSIENISFVNDECGNLGLPCTEQSCCKVTKKIVEDKWLYDYQIVNNCNDEGYVNKDVILDKDVCKKKNLVSCRRANFECVEFMNKEDCHKIPGMLWSQHTCEIAPLYDPLF
jgi:hypothetical protein